MRECWAREVRRQRLSEAAELTCEIPPKEMSASPQPRFPRRSVAGARLERR